MLSAKLPIAALVLALSVRILCGQEDSTPPELVSFSVSQTVVDVTGGPATILVRIVARDNLSGLESWAVGIDIRSADGKHPFGSMVPRVGGTSLEGVFEIALKVPQHIEPGIYPISLFMYDAVYNHLRLSSADLQARGFPSEIRVVSVGDTEPPELVSFSVSQTVVDVTSGPATILVRFVARDNLSGFEDRGGASIDIRSTDGKHPFGSTVPLVGGTSLEGIFEIVLKVPQHIEPGVYPISLFMYDAVYNQLRLSSADLQARGLPSEIRVASVGDTEPPELVSFSVSQTVVDVTSGPATILVRFVARDNLSGFEDRGGASIDIRSTDGKHPFGSGVPRVGGTSLEGVFEIVLKVPQHIASGIYPISLSVYDVVYNELRLSPADLQARGLPAFVRVVAQHSPATQGLRFVPIPPCRVVDTRWQPGLFGGPALGAEQERSFSIARAGCGVSSSAAAYSLNVTVIPTAGALYYLTLWPTGQPKPLVSTLNSFDGRIKANAAIVPAGVDGAVSVFATNAADVVLDINGYFVETQEAEGLVYYPVAPCRMVDTRAHVAPFGGPALTAGQRRTFPLRDSACGIPSEAQAYALNFTVVPRGALAYLTTWPAGSSQPHVSTLNSFTGAVVANAAIVPAGENGAIDVFVSDETDVVIDVTGFFGPPSLPGGLKFYPVAPCRVSDTRSTVGPWGGPAIASGEVRSIPLGISSCSVPADAQAYSLNATVVPRTALRYLTLWATGLGQPFVSTLNSFDGAVASNAAIVPGGANGSVSAFVTDASDLVLDLNGYFAP